MVSLIIPVYNVAKYIERCARSLFEQTLEEMEFVFVDDCSPDDSIDVLRQVLQEYPARIEQVKIVRHDVNKGLAAARNTGLQMASGEYIAHCDSDDWVEKDMYERMLCEARRSSADLVSCDFFMEYGSVRWVYNEVSDSLNKIGQLRNFIQSGWTVVWNKLVHRDVYFNNDVLGYEGLDFCEDYGLSVRLMYYAKCYRCIHTPLYHYNRVNVNSMVSRYEINQDKHTESQIQICSKINTFFIHKGLYEELEQVLSFRMLAAKRGWLFRPDMLGRYLLLYPESNKWINVNPLCSMTDKICQHLILQPYLRIFLPLFAIIKKRKLNIK